MKKRILTGITTTGIPHIGNFFGAIKPAIELSDSNDAESFLFLADLHAIIKQNDHSAIEDSVKNVALAWLSAGLNPDNTNFYRQSDIPEISELAWILGCVTSKGLINRSHAYKAAVDQNKANNLDDDKAITMGLFSYPVLMAADILIFNATHVPVGSDQIQHLEMTRDIAGRFNHIYKNDLFNLPEAITNDDAKTIPGLDGRKMSKSYNNVIPFLCSEKELQKGVMRIVTNSLEPGVKKDIKDCNLFTIYSSFASNDQIDALKKLYADGVGWGEAKKLVFNDLNAIIEPVRDRYFDLLQKPDYLNEVLDHGSLKVAPIAKELLEKVRDLVGIKKIS
ncbi:MAG: tryptophan--tRNA ligase [Gammaproteobacteria bacterium TMED104]|nr:MAG: tryptophan--tRNA ligase [Gammaproteobacteria bacterium TMED104]